MPIAFTTEPHLQRDNNFTADMFVKCWTLNLDGSWTMHHGNVGDDPIPGIQFHPEHGKFSVEEHPERYRLMTVGVMHPTPDQLAEIESCERAFLENAYSPSVPVQTVVGAHGAFVPGSITRSPLP